MGAYPIGRNWPLWRGKPGSIPGGWAGKGFSEKQRIGGRLRSSVSGQNGAVHGIPPSQVNLFQLPEFPCKSLPTHHKGGE